jgi:hypothetical protein
VPEAEFLPAQGPPFGFHHQQDLLIPSSWPGRALAKLAGLFSSGAIFDSFVSKIGQE